MNTWKPIETAPKDGTLILGWLKAKHRDAWDIKVVRWDSPRVGRMKLLDPEWIDNENYMVEDYDKVTHWMPIPNPPTK